MAFVNSTSGHYHATEAGASSEFTSGAEVTKALVSGSKHGASGRKVALKKHNEMDELWDVGRLLYQSQENDLTCLAAMYFDTI